MVYVDVKLFHGYIGAAMSAFTYSHDCEYCYSCLLQRDRAVLFWHCTFIDNYRAIRI